MKFNIRPAEARDGAEVVAMAQELSAHESKPVRSFDETDFRRDGFGADPAFLVRIAEVAGQSAGYALFHPTYDAEGGERGLYIHDLYVRPAYRDQGIGRALLAAVCQAARDSGGSFVWWCMIDGNRKAEAFYGRHAVPLQDLRIWIADGEHFNRLVERAA
ncbi:MAG: GNAT family N-acetyltransferase [Pseudomonadota bacterium]